MTARATPTTIQGKPCLGLADATVHLGLASTSKAAVWRKIQAGHLHGLQDARGAWFVPVAELDRHKARAADTSRVGAREAAALLDVATTTVRDWAQRGVLAGALDDGGRWSFARKSVAAHAKNLALQREGLTASQAARYCSLGQVNSPLRHLNTLNDAVKRGELSAFVDASGRRRFHQQELDRFLVERAKQDRHVPGTLSAKEAADVLGVTDRSTVAWFAERGQLDRVRVGRYWRYPVKSVQALKRRRDKAARAEG
ncbi:helix-turn-helix domain-containing protein [Paraburkholderia sp. BL21I4N1]|uniref:helix-turn-helix domain-containing protein n=1 Tax=Paraburkholderia sp. BL21I4N1 TaxID=1938801 RepID=UPI000D4AFED8|nr:helix-turn-helix domain-containing protein [Paraburkholderia sp. BL21I4N1]PQV53433.1 helix-turn-helix protein [Paraburkholderia sp. BL21I4N1]